MFARCGEVVLETTLIVDPVEHHLCCGLEAQANELLFLEVVTNRVIASLVALLTVSEMLYDPIGVLY